MTKWHVTRLLAILVLLLDYEVVPLFCDFLVLVVDDAAAKHCLACAVCTGRPLFGLPGSAWPRVLAA